MEQNRISEPESFEERLERLRNWMRETPTELRVAAAMMLTSVVIGFVIPSTIIEFFASLAFWMGVLIAVATAARHYKVGFLRTVAPDDVIDQWGALIQGAHERGEALIEDVANRIRDSKAPNIRMEQREVAPGWVRGMLGGRRPFLVISDRDHPRLKAFRMYVNARPYGENLQVNWYLLQQPGLGETILKLLLLVPLLNLLVLPFVWIARSHRASDSGLLELDFFDQQDLSAYVTNAHRCVLAAADQLMVDLSQDPLRLERKSRGFFGVS